MENIIVLATNMKLVDGEEMDKQEELLVWQRVGRSQALGGTQGLVMTNRVEHWGCLETDSAV